MSSGRTDRYLYTNDLIGGRAVAVRLDLDSGETKAFAGPCIKRIPDGPSLGDVVCYLFHSKFNRQNTRIMRVFRALPESKGRQKLSLFTFDTDASDVRLAVDHHLWLKGGHHPNWHPDGEHRIMNLQRALSEAAPSPPSGWRDFDARSHPFVRPLAGVTRPAASVEMLVTHTSTGERSRGHSVYDPKNPIRGRLPCPPPRQRP